MEAAKRGTGPWGPPRGRCAWSPASLPEAAPPAGRARGLLRPTWVGYRHGLVALGFACPCGVGGLHGETGSSTSTPGSPLCAPRVLTALHSRPKSRGSSASASGEQRSSSCLPRSSPPPWSPSASRRGRSPSSPPPTTSRWRRRPRCGGAVRGADRHRPVRAQTTALRGILPAVRAATRGLPCTEGLLLSGVSPLVPQAEVRARLLGDLRGSLGSGETQGVERFWLGCARATPPVSASRLHDGDTMVVPPGLRPVQARRRAWGMAPQRQVPWAGLASASCDTADP